MGNRKYFQLGRSVSQDCGYFCKQSYWTGSFCLLILRVLPVPFPTRAALISGLLKCCIRSLVSTPAALCKEVAAIVAVEKDSPVGHDKNVVVCVIPWAWIVFVLLAHILPPDSVHVNAITVRVGEKRRDLSLVFFSNYADRSLG